MISRCLVATLVAAGLVAGLRAQDRSQPAFRTEINLVRLAVRALDDQDHVISGSSTWMSREVNRRKTVILISNGTGCDVVTCASALAQGVRAARSGDASVYPLSPDGLIVPGYVSPIPGDLPPARLKSPLSALNVLAQDTGGFVIADTNGIEEGLDRVVDDGRSYYLLTYYSNNELKNGQTRRLTLTTSRKNVRLFYRQSYVVGEP